MKDLSTKSSKYILALLVFLGVVVPRLYGLDQYVTADEGLWLQRGGNFYYALSTLDFEKTYAKEHPGVVPMWAAAASFLLEYPAYRGIGPGYLSTIEEIQAVLEAHGQSPLALLVTARGLMIVLQGVVFALAYLLLADLLGVWLAFFGALFVVWDPYFFALTRLLHLDGMMGSMLFLSVVAICGYLEGKQRRYLIISGLAAAGGWLTKSPATILLPFIGLVLLFDFFTSSKAERTWIAFNQKVITPYLVWGGSMLAVIFILWPAMWVAPINSVWQIYKEALAFGVKEAPRFYFGGEIVLMESVQYIFYPTVFMLRSSPLVLIGLVSLIPAYIYRFSIFDKRSIRRTVLFLLLMAVLFTLSMSLLDKKYDRYLVPVFPFLSMAAALGWVAVIDGLMRLLKLNNQSVKIGVFVLVALGQLYYPLSRFPYPITYYNPIFGGQTRAYETISVGWGEGLDQAAAYLNAKPNAENLTVMSSMGHGAFSFYFKGDVLWMSINRLEQADYYVLYAHHRQDGFPPQLLAVFDTIEPEHIVYLGEIPYAWIYNRADIPPAEIEAIAAFRQSLDQ